MDADVFKALSDPNRLKIVEMLRGGELCACKILEAFDFTQPTLSHHMSVLSKCGLVDSRKVGQWTHYSINQDRVREVIAFLDGLLEGGERPISIDCCRCIYIDNCLCNCRGEDALRRPDGRGGGVGRWRRNPLSAWDFVQDQILGMDWLNGLVGGLLTRLGVDTASQLGSSLQFFIYDTVKILILLIVLIFIISYIQSYFPPERVKRILGRVGGLTGRVAGALLGTVTPFCSCSSIPIFIGFNKAGLPLGTSISFLISSPLVDLASIVVLMGIFGPETALLYVIVGIVLAVAGGTVVERLHMEDQIEEFARAQPCGCGSGCDPGTEGQGPHDARTRSAYAWEQVRLTVGRVWKYVLVGVLIGALIHDWIPEDVILAVLGDGNPFSVIIATLIGVPMYADIFGTIPIAEALIGKGVEIGTILAFMMGVTATSLPSVMMLKSVMSTRLLATFLAIVVVSIVVTGYLFNFLQPVLRGFRMFGKKKDCETTEGAFVKILGSGCRNCNLLEAHVRQALAESGLDDSVEHVTGMEDIAAYGVMRTPSLVFGREVVSVGRVLSVDEAKELISKHRGMFE